MSSTRGSKMQRGLELGMKKYIEKLITKIYHKRIKIRNYLHQLCYNMSKREKVNIHDVLVIGPKFIHKLLILSSNMIDPCDSKGGWTRVRRKFRIQQRI